VKPPIGAAEALALAREALEDDRYATPGPWSHHEDVVDGRLQRDTVMSASGAHQIAIAESGDGAPADFHGADAAWIAAARAREPALARWVEEALGADFGTPEERAFNTEWCGSTVANEGRDYARALAAALLRAADESEADQ
jgi:hypothetical protein